MNPEQIIRIDRMNNEPLYLLDRKIGFDKIVYKISGSTNNIYNVQIYTYSKKIYCNCPDAKKWARINKVVCKHSCFVLLKVLKLENYELFFSSYKLNDSQIEYIQQKNNSINLNNENEFTNKTLIDRFNNMKDIDKTSKIIIPKPNQDKFCCICYDDFEKIEDNVNNIQCKQCFIIIHKLCLDKWTKIGNTTCPYCRTSIKINNSGYKNLFD